MVAALDGGPRPAALDAGPRPAALDAPPRVVAVDGASQMTTIAELVERFDLPESAPGQLAALLDGLADPSAPTTVHAPEDAVDVHLADALVALELDAVRQAATIADLGAGAGFPGLALAAARPDAAFTLIESARRRASFIERLAAKAQIANVAVLNARAEEATTEHDAITARALAELPVVLEYAAPLLHDNGTAVVWRGRRDPEEERRAATAASELGLELQDVRSVRPFPGAQHRHLHAYVKVAPTPDRFPRRAGMARKRPLGGRPGPSLPS
jgi:16S rRNA (guanine527-N7)-methyltransferase